MTRRKRSTRSNAALRASAWGVPATAPLNDRLDSIRSVPPPAPGAARSDRGASVHDARSAAAVRANADRERHGLREGRERTPIGRLRACGGWYWGWPGGL